MKPADRTKPYAYLYPAAMGGLIEHLQRRGVEVQELREDIDLDVRIHSIETSRAGWRSGRQQRRRSGWRRSPSVQVRRIEAGTILVKTGQKQDRVIRRSA